MRRRLAAVAFSLAAACGTAAERPEPPAPPPEPPKANGIEDDPAPPPELPAPNRIEDAKLALEEAQASLAAEDYAYARATAASAIAACLAAAVEPEPEEAYHLLVKLGSVSMQCGDFGSALSVFEHLRDESERNLPPDHGRVQRSRANLAIVLLALGRADEARSLQEEVLAVLERTLPPEHEHILVARLDLARTLSRVGDIPAALELQKRTLADLRRISENHPQIALLELDLSGTLHKHGDLEEALEHSQVGLAAYEAQYPPDHPDLQKARIIVSAIRLELGRFDLAEPPLRAAIESLEATAMPDDPTLQLARSNLGLILFNRGERAQARDLYRQAIAVMERIMPADDPRLLGTRNNLADTLRTLGDPDAAIAVLTEVLAVLERKLPTDHNDILLACDTLAAARSDKGDQLGARGLLERVLETRRRTLPAEHPDLQRARMNLARNYSSLGDAPAARPLLEQALEVAERTRPETDHVLRGIRQSMAAALHLLGDHEGVGRMMDAVVASAEANLPAGDPMLLNAQLNQAIALGLQGRASDALPIAESVLAVREGAGRPRDLGLPESRRVVAHLLAGAGETARARELYAQAATELRASLPEGHSLRIQADADLAQADRELGDPSRLAEDLGVLAGSLRAGILGTATHSARESAEQLAFVHPHIGTLVSLAPETSSATALAPEVFRIVETRRAVATRGIPRIPEGDAELRSLRDRTGELRWRVQEAAERGETDGAVIAELVRDRDQADRALRAALHERGLVPPEVSVEALAAALPPDAAAVGFASYAPAGTPAKGPADERLLAHVVTSDGALRRIELGPLAEVAGLVIEWRDSVGEPIEPRGLPTASRRDSVEARERAALEALRARILDPVLAASPAKRLFVALDGPLHLVPLEALVRESAAVPTEIHVEISFARLLSPSSPSPSQGGLVAFGGIDYGAPDVDPARGPSSALAALPQTELEVRRIGERFRSSFGGEADVRTGGTASKEEFTALAPRARFLHVATHGWFADAAPDAMLAGVRAGARPATGPLDVLRGLAPMTLCGLAFADANSGRDDRGSLRGILTAEEVAAFDLSSCDLAILSACDTNVGIARAGLGIQSLQAALHAAGARTAITSLWKVPDEATRELMVEFYRRLWDEKKPKRQALREAQQRIREARDDRGDPKYSTRDWAAWVLTGDPG